MRYQNGASLQLSRSQTSHFVPFTKFSSSPQWEKTHLRQAGAVGGRRAELGKSRAFQNLHPPLATGGINTRSIYFDTRNSRTSCPLRRVLTTGTSAEVSARLVSRREKQSQELGRDSASSDTAQSRGALCRHTSPSHAAPEGSVFKDREPLLATKQTVTWTPPQTSEFTRS